ncbi:MAG TPA: DUF6072 family protein [Bryobacteraceae bacterium]|nr:DUF6072 family protein [Bryobacteraceae bacterium]
MPNDSVGVQGVRTGVEFASEALVPGGSNLVKGDLMQGGIHAVLGFAARAAFGLPGLLLVSANSFTKAVTGQHLYEHLNLGPQRVTSPKD